MDDDTQCPSCADTRQIELVSFVVMRDGREIETWACSCCGHSWTVEVRRPSKPLKR